MASLNPSGSSFPFSPKTTIAFGIGITPRSSTDREGASHVLSDESKPAEDHKKLVGIRELDVRPCRTGESPHQEAR
jgi:hypothetical protein